MAEAAQQQRSSSSGPDRLATLRSMAFGPMQNDLFTSQSSGTQFVAAHVGSVDIYRIESCGRWRGLRRQQHIRRDRVDDFFLEIPLTARMDVRQGSGWRSVEPGYCTFLSTAHPYEVLLRSNTEAPEFSSIHVRLSGPILRKHFEQIEAAPQQVIKLLPGCGLIMRAMLESVLAEGESLTRDQHGRLADALIALITETAVQALGDVGRAEGIDHFARLRSRAERYILEHISDPYLSVRKVADHCRVSQRYLQNAFAAAGSTLSSYRRELRLQMCRDSLLSPALRHLTILDVALRWGFNNPAHFSRVYAHRFGRPPSVDRRSQVLEDKALISSVALPAR